LSLGDLETAIAHLNDIAKSEPGESLTQDEIHALRDLMTQLVEALQEKRPDTASALSAAAEAAAGELPGTTRDALHQTAEALDALSQAQSQDAALQQAQAGVQLAQQPLRQASGQTLASGKGQAGSDATVPITDAGQTGSSTEDGTGEGTGVGANGDGDQMSGSAGTISEQEMERLAAVGGEITLPHSAEQGNPVLVPGTPNESRVPYQEVYMEYADTAEASLSRSTYPPLLRDYIHDYFSSLEE
jgi:hypothetical protein